MADKSVIKSAFELRSCVEMGVSPNLQGCRDCGVVNDDTFYFDVLNGNTVCKDCLLAENRNIAETQAGVYLPATSSVIVAMQYVENTKIERLFSFALTDESFALFYAISEKYLLNQVGKSFITLDLYNEQIKN
jgi:DNA repair protein RecO (recombination protein O)